MRFPIIGSCTAVSTTFVAFGSDQNKISSATQSVRLRCLSSSGRRCQAAWNEIAS